MRSHVSVEGNCENLKARDILENKIDFCFSFHKCDVLRLFSAFFPFLEFTYSCLSHFFPKPFQLLHSRFFASSLHLFSLSSSSSLFIALYSSFSVISVGFQKIAQDLRRYQIFLLSGISDPSDTIRTFCRVSSRLRSFKIISPSTSDESV